MRLEDEQSLETHLTGGGEIGSLLRSLDWAQTDLGGIETWSDSLKTAVQVLLTELDRRSVSAQSAAEATQAFRVRLSDALRPLADPIAIQETASRLLGEHLGVNRVVYFEVRGDDYVVERDYAHEVAGLCGRYPIAVFGAKLLDAYRTGRPVTISNIQDDPNLSPAQRSAFAAIKIEAYIGVALIKEGVFVAGLSVHSAQPRTWRAEEVALVEEVAEQTWSAVERERSYAALRQSQAELEQQVQKFEVTLSTLIDQVYGFDHQGRVLYANQALLDLWGASAAEVVGKTIAELHYPPAVEQQFMHNLRQVFATKTCVKDEVAYTMPNGVEGYFEYSLSPVFAADGTVDYVVGSSRNIHDRKLAEARIASDLENTRLLHELSTKLLREDNIQVLYDEILATAIALTQADAGTVQIVDNDTQDIVLLAGQGFDRTIIDRFYRVNAGSNTSCGVAMTTGTRALVDFDVPEAEDPHGSLCILANAGFACAQSTPLVSRSGKAIGMVSTHWRQRHRPSDRELRFLDLLARQAADLIEQRQIDAECQQLLEREQAARAEAERANRLKDEFLAVLSHELRTPMNPIIGWVSLLKQGKLDATKTAHAIATIDRNAKLQVQLIDDLLDISRILQGKLRLEHFAIDLTFVIRSALETVRLSADAKAIAIETDFSTHVGYVNGDAGRLQQVMWNLLSNAVKFTPRGGRITITLEAIEGMAQIRVQDTGKGIHPDFLPDVFEHFRQEDSATTRQFGGLGLGLAIVRQIVQMHGGSVQAISAGDQMGATFVVNLPLLPLPASIASALSEAIDAAAPLTNLKVLLVDDEGDTRDFQAFVLEQTGAEVVAVASGIEALQHLEQGLPDLLVSDLAMPEMDGFELLEQIRARPPHQGGVLPAIALTARATECDQLKVKQAGFQAHLTKPIDPDALVQAIANLKHDRMSPERP